MYSLNHDELYQLWKDMCGREDKNIQPVNRKISKKKKITPKSKREQKIKSPLDKKNISQLKKMCKEHGLKKYSSLKKKDLIELLQNEKKKSPDKDEQPLEDILDAVQENMENLDINKKKPDFNEEDIVEEY